jgi:hypothetical protein
VLKYAYDVAERAIGTLTKQAQSLECIQNIHALLSKACMFCMHGARFILIIILIII